MAGKEAAHVVQGAVIKCQFSTEPLEFNVTSQNSLTLKNKAYATIEDSKAGTNIIAKPSCKCLKNLDPNGNPLPCTPQFSGNWVRMSPDDPKNTVVNDKALLLDSDCLNCMVGSGMIKIEKNGQ